jgi:hypothetical protein
MNEPTAKPPSAPKPVRSGQRVFILWLGLVLFFLAIWQFQEGDSSDVSKPHSFDMVFWMPQIMFGVFLVAGVIIFVRVRRLTNRLVAAVALVARGEVAQGEPALASLSNSNQLLVRAQALLWLATLAERRADFARALELCDAGLAAVPKQLRAQTADFFYPGLVALRASLLAALDRSVEAESELMALRQHYPWFPSITRATFATRLRAKVRAGDVAGASALASSRSPTLPLTAEEELLADVAMCAADAPGAQAAIELRKRLDAWPEGATWLERSAPALVGSLVAAARV